MSAVPWAFDIKANAAERLPRLEQKVPFEQIMSEIATKLDVLCCHKSEVKGTDFRRPVYSVTIGNELFDQFFNSATGYRAQYFRSCWAGLGANAMFMRAVSPVLVRSALAANSGLSAEFISESLATSSAKAWLTESGKELCSRCQGCKGEWSAGSVGVPNAAEIRNNRWELTQTAKAEWGRKAPYLTKLRIMGAFLDTRLNEFVPWDKRFRAEEIHQFGWS